MMRRVKRERPRPDMMVQAAFLEKTTWRKEEACHADIERGFSRPS